MYVTAKPKLPRRLEVLLLIYGMHRIWECKQIENNKKVT